MSVPGKVMWAELQSELNAAGLSASVDIPRAPGPWNGTIDELLFLMTISPRNEVDGHRDFLIVSLFGQDEEKTLEALTEFMGYSPFCKYQDKRIDEAAAAKGLKVTGTYEWDKKDPNGRLVEINQNGNIYDLKTLEKGFEPIAKGIDVADRYQQITPDVIAEWEAAVKKNPDAEWHYGKIADILPFVKSVNPRIGKTQSLFGLSIISLDRVTEYDNAIVLYGLSPLREADILTEKEAHIILDWFRETKPTWDSNPGGFSKTFEVEGHKYRLATDCCRGHRDLNIYPIHEEKPITHRVMDN